MKNLARSKVRSKAVLQFLDLPSMAWQARSNCSAGTFSLAFCVWAEFKEP